MTVEGLGAAARQQNIAKIEGMQWAVMETSGAIGFIKKSDA